MLRGAGLQTSEFKNLSGEFNAEFVSGGRNTEIEAFALTRKEKTLCDRIRAHLWKLPAETDGSRPKQAETARNEQEPVCSNISKKETYANRIRKLINFSCR